MTSPLQAAARALCMAQSGTDCFDDLEPEAQEQAIDTVRAVILAIREPSKEMAEAVRGTALEPCFPESDWRRMIDALLADK